MITTTAIIGVGLIGEPLARHLADGGERLVLAARDGATPTALARELGERVVAAPVRRAIADADVVVLAVPFGAMPGLIAEHADLLAGKVVVDPSNPIAPDGRGNFPRTLPAGQSAGAVIAALLPRGAHYVKAFSTLAFYSLRDAARRTPERAALLYATDDARAAAAVERLISAAGFDPVHGGGVVDALRVEFGGDLHEMGGLRHRLVSAREARAAVAARARSAA